jgi:ketosteroid isomerase-like protein
MSKSESIDANKEIARRFVTAIPVTDPDETEVRATMAEDAVWEFPLAGDYKPELKAFTGPTRWNREEMIAMQLAFRSNLKKPYKLELSSLVAEGDKVVAEAHGEGVSAATGRTYKQRYCFHLTLRDGLIVHGRVYQDTLHLWDIWMYSAPKDFFLDLK